MKKSVLGAIRDFFFPPKCAVCGSRIDGGDSRAMCVVCYEKYMTEIRQGCKVCGKAFSDCICVPKNFVPDEFAYALPYDTTGGSIRKLILCCKNRRHSAVIEEIVNKMVETAEQRSIIDSNTVVCYVPRSPEKTMRLGVDQAKNFAEAFAKAEKLTCLPIITRSSAGKDQKTLTQGERAVNVVGLYEIAQELRHTVKGKNVIIIDDIVTTGSTVNSCASILKESGAERVICLSAARSVGGGKGNNYITADDVAKEENV